MSNRRRIPLLFHDGRGILFYNKTKRTDTLWICKVSETKLFIFCNVIALAEIRTLCGHILKYHAITDCKQWILRHEAALKQRFDTMQYCMSMQRHRELRIVLETISPICKEQSLLSSYIAVGLQLCFIDLCICNNLEKRGAMPLHFQRLFSTFVGDILNYGSVTLFSCDERRKFQAQ